MAKANYYEVTLKPSNEAGAKRTMFRAGYLFELKVPQVLELEKDIVEVFKNDRRFSIKKTNAPSESVESDETSESEVDTQSDTAETEEVSTDEAQDSEDQDPTSTEEASDEVTVDELLKLSRADLNAMAEEAGVENADKLENKTEVAQAIVDVKALPESQDETTSNE